MRFVFCLSLILGLVQASLAQSPPVASATPVVVTKSTPQTSSTTVQATAVSGTAVSATARVAQPITQPRAKPPAANPQDPEQAGPNGYADCSSRKYNNAYGENTIKIYRQKGDSYLVKSSQFLKKDYPLFIKGWISEKDCKAIMLRVDSPLEIESLKAKTLVVKSKAKLKLNRIFFVSQELPSQLFKNTYISMHMADLSDEKKQKSTLTGFIIGTQIHANSIFRLSVELQSDSWKSKTTSTTKSIFFLGFASCAPIDSLSGKTMKIDLCAKLLAGKSSDPNLNIKYNFSPQVNFDITKSWRIYGQGGLTSVVSRSDGMPENIFGLDLEAGLAYRF